MVLYAFFLFFFGLVFWLRREDRREGYPLEA
ncbi:photosynthetic reaction center subunit H, partial [Methylobacterium sp. WL103]